MKKYSLLFIATTLLLGCEKTIDYDIPFDAPKITIDAKLRTDTSVTAIVGTSRYILDNEGPEVDDRSTVYLYENGNVVDTLLPERFKDPIFSPFGNSKIGYYYQGDYRPLPGFEYEVRAEREGYTTAFGREYMPAPITITSSSYDQTSGEIEVSFIDPPGEGDYYRISINTSDEGPGSPDYYIKIFGSYDPTIEFFEFGEIDNVFDTEGISYGHAGFLSDEFFNGKTKTLKLLNYIFGEPIDTSGGQVQLSPFSVVIARVSRSFYLHARSKSGQQSDNPFSEPIPIFGNIENGYGIVATSAIAQVKIIP